MRAGVMVIGGGLAGSAISTLLAKQGRDVTLFEKSRGERDKLCGEFYSAEAAHYLAALDVDLTQLGAVPIRRVRLASHSVIAEDTLPFKGFSLPRRIVDEHLMKQAEAAGVRVMRAASVENLSREADGWAAALADGSSCKAKDAFVATGKHDLRSRGRRDGSQNDLVAFKMYFALNSAEAAIVRDAVELILFSGGYAGLQPVDHERVNLTLVIQQSILRRHGAAWNAVLHHAMASSHYLRQRLHGATPLLAKPLALSSIPYGFIRRAADGEPWFLGDQCAVIPSFTGDGMSIALHSAFVAAEMYRQGGTSLQFQAEIARQLQRPMRIATALSRTMISAPLLANLLCIYPHSLAWIASQTRIPQTFLQTVQNQIQPMRSRSTFA